MTSEELVAACLRWQERLRLRDWEVRLRLVPRGELENPDVYGSVTWLLNHKAANISLVESADMAAHDPQYDQERTLVHELLHLYFIPWETGSGTPEDTALEQALTAIARALVTLDRQHAPLPAKE